MENFKTVEKSLLITMRYSSKSTKYSLENCRRYHIENNKNGNSLSLLWYFAVDTKAFTWWRMLIDFQITCMCATWYEA